MEPKTILLIEDSPDDVALTEAAFARLGLAHRLIVASDGESALDLLVPRTQGNGPSELPDLVLLDLKLPGMDGFEVLRRVRGDARASLLPVVVLTSSVEERDVSTSYRLGANSYIRKPIDFDEFVPIAAQILRYWLGLNEPPALGVQS